MLPYSPVPGEHPEFNQELRPETPREKRSPWLIAIASLLVLIILGGTAFAYYYFFLRVPSPSVDLSVAAPDTVMLGQPFSLVVSYSNTSDQILKDTILVLNLPTGVSLVNSGPDKRFSEESVGDVPGGRFGNQTFNLIATADSQSVKRLDVKLRYGLETDPSHTSSRSAFADVAVGGPVVSVNLSLPQNVASGQDFEITANIRNESPQPLDNIKFAFVYPRDLLVKETIASEGISNTGAGTWIIQRLASNATGTVSITGNTPGNTPSFSLPAALSLDINGRTYVIWKETPTISVAQAPLAISIMPNDKADYVARLGDTIQYHITYKNNATVALQNVVIKTDLVSPLFNYARLTSAGDFSSIAHTLTWNSANTPALASIAAGASGEVTFIVPIRSDLTIQRISDRNFTLKVRAEIQSPTVPPGVSAEKTISITNLETKVAGDIALNMLAYYYEPSSSIKNTGPLPPRVNKTTQFTIHWKLRNGSTDMGNVRVSAVLGPNVRFTNVVQAANAAKPVYDAATGRVTWDIPQVSATQGIIGIPLEAIFQVEVTPAINQVGQSIQLISDASLAAKDLFTGTTIQKTETGKTSDIPDDPRGTGKGRVIP